jgi:DNA-directed RNA polymerase specialized sigma24 family protein
VLDEVRPEHAHTPIESLSRALQFRDLVDDVQALPDMQRTALLLREIDGFAYQEIATAMDTTVPAVKSLLVRARCGLRESRSARDAGPGAAPAGDRGRARARRDCTAASYPAARAAAVALA